jgi:phosphatidylglycerophosphate synthase
VVAFVVALMALVLAVGLVLTVARRRPPGAALTWGEAMAAAAFVFFTMFLAYGIVPHQWLAWADNELNWRADKILYGPGDIVAKLPFTVTYQVLRDIIVAGIYVVFLSAMVLLWSMWQSRGKTKPAELPVSSYGRPLVKKA